MNFTASLLIMTSLLFSQSGKIRGKASVQLYGDYQCMINLKSGISVFDAEIREVRSIGVRHFSWRLYGETDSLVLVGRCGYGATCGFSVDNFVRAYVIERDSLLGCRIREVNDSDVFD